MKILIILCALFVVMTFMTYACCVVAGDADRIAETMYIQHIKTKDKNNENVG